MRAKIEKTDQNEVTLAITDADGYTTRRVFWISRNGGNVREGEKHSADDPTICRRLGYGGYALYATDVDDLLATIRREWKARQRAINGW